MSEAGIQTDTKKTGQGMGNNVPSENGYNSSLAFCLGLQASCLIRALCTKVSQLRLFYNCFSIFFILSWDKIAITCGNAPSPAYL